MSGSASSMYMCYGSIRGEAEVPGQVTTAPASGGWMKLSTCSLAASVNFGQRFGLQQQGGGDVTPVQVTKVSDASSTGLFREALLGKADRHVVITYMRTTPGGGPQEYMRFELEDCGIVEFSVESGGEERATENFAISYGRMSVISWGYDTKGQPTGRAMASIQNVA